MIGGKSNAWQRAYLAGIQAQTSVYGATIPVYYGRMRGSPLLIWQNGLRKGAGLSQKKGKKKGSPNFVENVDFLLGHNPIAGALQFWYNNAKLTLDFKSQRSLMSLHSPPNATGYVTVTDPNFYFVVGVTAEVDLSGTFNDYGGPGSVPYSGTYDTPLWNVNYAGPDPTSQNGYREYPATYQWFPYSGPTVVFPASVPYLSGWTGYVTVYYAALAPNTFHLAYKGKDGSDVPITALRLAFESQLGGGTEFANYPTQRIIYPEYAGMESSDFDMGSSGVAAATLPEIMGMFPVWPTGDCDYSDMIEDVFKSGPAQAGTGAAVGYGDIHHGLGCLDFPGLIQKKVLAGSVNPWFSKITYDLKNTAGNYLFVMVSQSTVGVGALGITDTAGNSWTPLIPGSPHEWQVWYCVSNGGGGSAIDASLNELSFSNYDRFMNIEIFEVGGLDTIDATSVKQGTGGVYSDSITTTNKVGQPAIIFSFVLLPGNGTGSLTDPPFHWEIVSQIFPNKAISTGFNALSQYNTKFPNTYSITYPSFGAGDWTGILVAMKNSQPNTFTSPLGNILDDTTMQQMRTQNRAYGLYGSLFMDSQKKASDWLKEFYRAGNAAPVWSGFSLKSIPYAEQSFAGNGAVYISPTASGPVANITESDFIAEGGDPPVTITRKAQVDSPNLQQIQYPNREADYNNTVASEPDNGSMSLYGTRKDSPEVFASITETVVARAILGIKIRETNIIRNSYSFKLQGKWALLEAMDLITIPIQSTMPATNLNQPFAGTIPIRLTSVKVNSNYEVECEAEPFIYGLRSPQTLTVTTPNGNQPQFGADPGSVNTPIIFQAPPKLSGTNNLNDLWFVISGASAAYGGCVAYISTDGGSSYNQLGPNGGIIQGNATTGVTVGDWPAHADPDMADNLTVDLTESLGELASYSVDDENNFVYPCYVEGGASGIPYELMAYAVADLLSPYNYELMATGTGNELRRAVWGMPTVGAGVDHPNGSRFAFLDPNNPNAAGILRIPIDPTWIGKTLYFKFTAFNQTGAGVQSLSDATAYTYTPTDTPGCVNSAGATPGVFLVNET